MSRRRDGAPVIRGRPRHAPPAKHMPGSSHLRSASHLEPLSDRDLRQHVAESPRPSFLSPPEPCQPAVLLSWERQLGAIHSGLARRGRQVVQKGGVAGSRQFSFERSRQPSHHSFSGDVFGGPTRLHRIGPSTAPDRDPSKHGREPQSPTHDDGTAALPGPPASGL